MPSLHARSAHAESNGITVVLADGSVLVREGAASLLHGAGFSVAARTGNVDELFELVDRLTPTIVIVALDLQSELIEDGVGAALRIRATHPSISLLVLSRWPSVGPVEQLFANGSSGVGYLVKDNRLDVDQFVDAVRHVADGGSTIDPQVVDRMMHRRRSSGVHELTERQRTVLELVARGRTNHAIGRMLHLTPKTVEAHIRGIFAKLDLPQTADDHRRVLAALAFLGHELS